MDVGPLASPVCIWDHEPVNREGEFCTYQCYLSWVVWNYAAHQGRRHGLIILDPDEPAPLPLNEQPWYDQTLREVLTQ